MEMQRNEVSKIITTTLRRKYPTLNEKQAQFVARELVLAPENRLIRVSEDQRLSKEDLSFVIAKEVETSSAVSWNERMAQSMERLNSGTDTVEEYFSWLSATLTILKHMNDGYVTEEDAIEREMFLKNTDQREGELMVCLGLYESCQSSTAQEKVKFIRYKLQKLREMRTAIQFLTKKDCNVETTRSEFDAAKPYYAYFKNLRGVPFGYDANLEKKAELGIRHDLDEDLSEDFDHSAFLKNEILDDMAFEQNVAPVRTMTYEMPEETFEKFK
ncbi:MAG: hypothetical protein J6X42_06105 [Alphaproteobacteria bacterium]|nr:hypothetical protein [Alphaproteobacteria bacterium]